MNLYTNNTIADLEIKNDKSSQNITDIVTVNQRKGQQLFIEQLIQNNCKRLKYFPDKQTAEAFIENLFEFLFVGQADCGCDSNTLTVRLNQLKGTFSALLFEVIKKEDPVKVHTENFFEALPGIYDRLLQDAEAIVKSDPAAQSIEEVLAAYPGFFCNCRLPVIKPDVETRHFYSAALFLRICP